jgi:D-alanine-D-alanine ligase-like ATP-grasp enzyme
MFVEKNNKEDFFDYESKYESESGMRETFPEIDSELRKLLVEMTQKAIDIFSIR